MPIKGGTTANSSRADRWEAPAPRVAEGTIEMTCRTRTVRNRHGSARVACERWLARSLWGDPIWLGAGKCHVYGAWSRRWVTVMVEFGDRTITVMRPAPRRSR